MKTGLGFIAFFIVGTLFFPITSMAKSAIPLQQKTIFVQSLQDDLLTDNDEVYIFNNEEIKLKAAELVGSQAQILYHKFMKKNVCVDISPITTPPFDIAPIPTRTSDRPL